MPKKMTFYNEKLSSFGGVTINLVRKQDRRTKRRRRIGVKINLMNRQAGDVIQKHKQRSRKPGNQSDKQKYRIRVQINRVQALEAGSAGSGWWPRSRPRDWL